MTASLRPLGRRTAEVWYTVADVAELLAVSKMSVYRLIEADELLAYRIGRNIRIKDSDLTGYLADPARQASRPYTPRESTG